MEHFFNTFADKLSDYGALVMLQFAVIAGLAWALIYQTKRLDGLNNRSLDVIVSNTSIMSKLSTQIEEMHHGKN